MIVVQLVIAYLQAQNGQQRLELKKILQLNIMGVHTTLRLTPKGDITTSNILELSSSTSEKYFAQDHTSIIFSAFRQCQPLLPLLLILLPLPVMMITMREGYTWEDRTGKRSKGFSSREHLINMRSKAPANMSLSSYKNPINQNISSSAWEWPQAISIPSAAQLRCSFLLQHPLTPMRKFFAAERSFPSSFPGRRRGGKGCNTGRNILQKLLSPITSEKAFTPE